MDDQILRLIDANANRAREGLRTAEDYLRFVLGESRGSAELKALRAELTAAIEATCPGLELLLSRKVESDPLRPTLERPERPAHENSGTGAEDGGNVARRGLKRAQEALRVLEEFLRREHPAASQLISRLRYRVYGCEAGLANVARMQVLATASIYVLISEKLCRRGLVATVQAILRGGAKVLQLREKAQADETYYRTALDLRKMCMDNGTVLICNDRVDVALAAGVEGIHLGQQDLPPAAVRKISGSRLLIGRSTHSVEQARHAVEVEQADYIAIGSMYETATKDQPLVAGLKLAEAVSALRLGVPVFAIGGIKRERIEALKSAGVRQIAVSSAIVAAPDPELETRKFIEAMAV